MTDIVEPLKSLQGNITSDAPITFISPLTGHGTTSGRYTYYQMGRRHAFATMSFIAEIIIFMYVGMDALDVEKWNFVNASDSDGRRFHQESQRMYAFSQTRSRGTGLKDTCCLIIRQPDIENIAYLLH